MPSRNQTLAVAEKLLTPAGLPVLQELVQKHLDEAIKRNDYDAITEYANMRKDIAKLSDAQTTRTDSAAKIAAQGGEPKPSTKPK